GSPSEGERKTQQKAAPDSRPRDAAAKVHIAVEPACQGRTKESNQGERKEVHRLKSRKKRTLPQQRSYSEARENNSKYYANAQVELDERADEVQAKEKNQCAGDRREQIAILL